MTAGELFILSAPSGAGKTTLIRGLFDGDLAASGDLHFSISHTTRSPREGEVRGKDYHFVDVPTFQRMMEEDAFLEWEEVHNNYYGTSLREVKPFLDRGVDVLMDIDVKGAERVLGLSERSDSELQGRVHSIFIMPPSFADLKERLHSRGLDDPVEIEGRLAVSRWEMRSADRYHYVIVNKDVGTASRTLAAIILEKRHRADRMRSRLDEILLDFAS